MLARAGSSESGQASHSHQHHPRVSQVRGLLVPDKAAPHSMLTLGEGLTPGRDPSPAPGQRNAPAQLQGHPNHSSLPSFLPSSSLPRSTGFPAPSPSSQHPRGTDVRLTPYSPQPRCYYSPPSENSARDWCCMGLGLRSSSGYCRGQCWGDTPGCWDSSRASLVSAVSSPAALSLMLWSQD